MRIALPIAAAVALATPLAAQAQVFEVGDDGAVRQTSSGPAQPSPAPRARSAPPSAVQAAAARYDLSPALIDAVAWQESRYNAAAVSPKGAVGIMQLMPGTAQALHVDPRDPVANIYGGAAYLRQLIDRFDGRIDLALAAYNAGPGAVVRHDGVPPYRETQTYVASALGKLALTSFSTPVPTSNGDHP